jgi:hypothetical protein
MNQNIHAYLQVAFREAESLCSKINRKVAIFQEKIIPTSAVAGEEKIK